MPMLLPLEFRRGAEVQRNGVVASAWNLVVCTATPRYLQRLLHRRN